MKIPNIDGTYQTKDGKTVIIVTRKEIEFTIAPSQKVHIIDDDQSGPKQAGPDRMERVTTAMNKSIKLLGFE